MESYLLLCIVILAEVRISTSNSKVMVLNQKWVACPLLVSREVLPGPEDFNYLGVYLDRQIGAKNCGEERAEMKGEALDLLLSLCTHSPQ